MTGYTTHPLSQFAAVVNGKPTGLAGCDTTTCPSRATCLRATEWLPRVNPTNGNDLSYGRPERCEAHITRIDRPD